MKNNPFKKSQKLKKLNIGCGTDYKNGWINIDNNSDNNITQLDLNWDLRKPLPYEDGTIDFIFNEHFFEHLTPEEGVETMKDLYRILKPGGVLRVAMPDLEQIVDNYSNLPLDKDPVLKTFKLDFIKTRAERINISFRNWGHKWLYDFEELSRRLQQAGFSGSKITRQDRQKSGYPELVNLEIRDESILVVEAIK